MLLLLVAGAVAEPTPPPASDIPAVACGDLGDGSDNCPAGDPSTLTGVREGANPLWRAAPYPLDTGKRWTAYGGQFVADAFQAAGFNGPVETDDWDLLFTYHPMAKRLSSTTLSNRPFTRLVNHCQYFQGAGQKCRMAAHLERVQLHLTTRGVLGGGNGGTRFLETYQLKNLSQSRQWRAAMLAEPGKTWVVKTCSGGDSQGIALVKHGDEQAIAAAAGAWSVAQEYVHRPFLGPEGRKFHVRVYVLVTRWEPISALVFRDGLVFRSRHSHNDDAPSLKRDVFSSVSVDVEPVALSQIWQELGADTAEVLWSGTLQLFRDVLGTSVTDSFGAVPPPKERGFDCFDLFGADVMFSAVDLKPLLLEINMSPNMWVDRQGDAAQTILGTIKKPMISQLTRWSAERIRDLASATNAELRAAENALLTGFSRIL